MKAFRAAREKIASVMRRAPDVNERQGIGVKSCNVGRVKGLVKQVWAAGTHVEAHTTEQLSWTMSFSCVNVKCWRNGPAQGEGLRAKLTSPRFHVTGFQSDATHRFTVHFFSSYCLHSVGKDINTNKSHQALYLKGRSLKTKVCRHLTV